MWTLSIGDPQKSMTRPLEVVISPLWLLQGVIGAEV